MNNTINSNKNSLSYQISNISTLMNNSIKNIQNRLEENLKPPDLQPDIFKACREGKLSSVKWLIEKEGVDPNKQVPYKIPELNFVETDTPIIIAARNGKLDIVKYLISIGVNKDSRNKWGWSALIKASKNGQTEVVRYLVSIGANKTFRNYYGQTAFDVASNNEIRNLLR